MGYPQFSSIPHGLVLASALDELHGADGTQEEDGGHLGSNNPIAGRNVGDMLDDSNGHDQFTHGYDIYIYTYIYISL